MSARFRDGRHALRRAAMVVSGCTLGAVLGAATPQPGLLELDEVQVTSKVPWPIEDYLEFPRYDSVVISPGGTQLAMGWGEENFQRRLTIVDFPSMTTRSSRLLQIYFGVADLHWVDEQRLVGQPDWPLRGFRRLREPLGTLLVTDINGRTLHELNPVPASTLDAFSGLHLLEGITRKLGEGDGPNSFGPVRAVAVRTGAADQLLYQTLWTGDGFKGSNGIFQLDLADCMQLRVATLPVRGGQVITGPDNRPALLAGVNEAGERFVYFLPEATRTDGKDWQLSVRSASGERGLVPVVWTGKAEEYYALDGRNSPTRAVVVWNASDNTKRLLYRHPDADMDVAWLDPAGKPWMFSGIRHHPVYWYPDPAHPLAQLHRGLVQQLPLEHVDILNATDDLATAVVRVSTGKRPTMYFVVDVKAAKSLTGMHTYPKLKGRRLAPVEAIEFPARDGLTIRGYLTTPLDDTNKPRRGLPLLVIAHDGPREEFSDYRYVPDSRYEFERQLFSSRGYAVLQVNVRGSSGRGAAFEKAGDGEWGRKVQDDYADAVRWAIKDGVAAAGHVCFYGSGYGAYSALMAAAREPDLFQCVIGLGGVYDLPLLLEGEDRAPDASDTAIAEKAMRENDGTRCFAKAEETAQVKVREKNTRTEINKALKEIREADSEPQEVPLALRRAIGGSDLEQLTARSPVTHAESIKAKVLLLQQDLDPLVPEEQLTSMRNALRAARNRPTSESIGDSGGYFTPASRAAGYKRMLEFLKQQIGEE